MTNNTKNTKKKLSIMFSIIFFVVILSLGVSFFTIKYFTEYSSEKKSFIGLTNLIQTGKIKITDIEKVGARIEVDILHNNKKLSIRPVGNNSNIPFLNYIHLTSDNYLISSNIRDEIDGDLIEDIINNNKYFDIKYSEDLFIQKFQSDNNETFIIFKKIHYSLANYLKDVLLYLIVSLLFGILIYIIGRKFVNKAFIPVEKNMDDMRNFIQNAGHELKTPISVIDSNLQLLVEMKKFDPEMNKEMKSEVKKLNSLIDSLVNLSDNNNNKNVIKNNLLDLIKEVEKNFKNQILNKKIEFNIKIAKNIIINANKDFLYIFISNLIGNAIKYNNIDGKIDIIYKNKELIIKDTGIGIKKEDLEKIFDRFYKSDISRNTEGFGIGLSLVRKISNIYNWNIKVNSELGKGTEIIVKLK